MSIAKSSSSNRIASIVLAFGLVLTVGAVTGAGGRDMAWAEQVDTIEAQVAAAEDAAAMPGADLPIDVAATDAVQARGLGDQAVDPIDPADVDAADAEAATEEADLQLAAAAAALPPAERLVRFTVPGGSDTFTTSDLYLPKAEIAVARALASVGNAAEVCDDGMCFNLCDHVAGDIWGYTVFSGYETAMTHWQHAVRTGVAHPGDRNVPLGALVFYETGREPGHVATYVGNGMVVTNATGSQGANIYLRSAEYSGYRYLGWAWPQFHGEDTGAAL